MAKVIQLHPIASSIQIQLMLLLGSGNDSCWGPASEQHTREECARPKPLPSAEPLRGRQRAGLVLERPMATCATRCAYMYEGLGPLAGITSLASPIAVHDCAAAAVAAAAAESESEQGKK